MRERERWEEIEGGEIEDRTVSKKQKKKGDTGEISKEKRHREGKRKVEGRKNERSN